MKATPSKELAGEPASVSTAPSFGKGVDWRDLPATLSGVAAGLILVGWLVAGPIREQLAPHGPVMKANTAIALLALAGAAFAARRLRARSRGPRVLVAVAATVSLAIAILTAFEYASGVSLGIDQAVARDPSLSAGSPGRVAISSVIAIALLSVALLGIGRRIGAVSPSEWMASAAAAIATLALIGDVFGVAQVSGLAGVSQMAPSTALVVVLLWVAVVIARPEHAIFQAVGGPDAGATFLRRFGAIGVGVPFVLGFVVLEAGRAGAFGFDFALSLGTFVAMGVGLGES